MQNQHCNAQSRWSLSRMKGMILDIGCRSARYRDLSAVYMPDNSAAMLQETLPKQTECSDSGPKNDDVPQQRAVPSCRVIRCCLHDWLQEGVRLATTSITVDNVAQRLVKLTHLQGPTAGRIHSTTRYSPPRNALSGPEQQTRPS